MVKKYSIISNTEIILVSRRKKMENALKTYKEKYESEDQTLFQAVINLKMGDKKSFEQVYKLSEKYIYSIIYRIVRDNNKTADLMQETYIQIYKKIHTLKNVETFLVWAGRIATNNTLRYIQKDSREVLLNEEENDFVFENVSDDKEEFLPEDILLNKVKQEKIREIINSLSQEQKVTVLYYYFGEMSVNEIAEAMQCSPGTVKSRLNYARKQIKQAVLDTEKREGVKLYSFSTLPLFTLLFREEMASVVVPEVVSSSVIKGIAEALGINMIGTAGMEALELGKAGLREAIHKFFQTVSGKVVSGVAVATIAGTVAMTQIPRTLYVTPDRIVDSVDSYFRYYADIMQYPEDVENPYLINDKYLVFKNDDGKEGIYTINGREVLAPEFDDILYDENTGGLFLVKKDGKRAYYDKSGKMVCDKMYDNVGNIIDGVFWCYDRDSDKYIIYSVDANPISDLTFDIIGEMANGLVVVKREGKWGVLKKDGSIFVDFQYDDIYLGDGEYIAINENIDYVTTRIIVLNSSGNKVFTKEYTGLTHIYRGFYKGVANLSGWYNYPMKPDGTIIFDPIGTEYSTDALGYNFELYPNGYFSYYNYNKNNGETALFNRDGEQIALSSYLETDYINNSFLITDNESGKCRLIDDEGNTIIPYYDKIWPRYKGKYYICQDNNGYDLYKEDGVLLFNDAADIESIGCEMFQCSTETEKYIVNGKDGTSFVLSSDERIESNYVDGYAVKFTRLREAKEGEPEFKYEIIDKKGKVKHKIEIPDGDYYDFNRVIVLKKGLFSYEYDDICYIKTW